MFSWSAEQRRRRRHGIDEEHVGRVVLRQPVEITGAKRLAPIFNEVSNLAFVVRFRHCRIPRCHHDFSLVLN
jgi:hypothetical protein